MNAKHWSRALPVVGPLLLFIVWPTLVSLGPGIRALDEVTLRVSCWRGYGALIQALPGCTRLRTLAERRGGDRHGICLVQMLSS